MSDTSPTPQRLSRRQAGGKGGKGQNVEKVKVCSRQEEQLVQRLRGENTAPAENTAAPGRREV